MPFGMSWGQYFSLATISISSMLAGATVVHHLYKPDLTVPDTPLPAPKVQASVAIVAPRGHNKPE